MNNYKHSAPSLYQDGVVLLEALIAVLIFSFGILGLVGLQATMVKGTTDAKYRSEANYIAQQILGKMWADPCNLAAYSLGSVDVPDRLPNGKWTVTHQFSGNEPKATCVPAQLIDQTRVEVTWQVPGEPDVHRVVNVASITGG